MDSTFNLFYTARAYTSIKFTLTSDHVCPGEIYTWLILAGFQCFLQIAGSVFIGFSAYTDWLSLAFDLKPLVQLIAFIMTGFHYLSICEDGQAGEVIPKSSESDTNSPLLRFDISLKFEKSLKPFNIFENKSWLK